MLDSHIALARILRDRKLAQFGDSLLNFTYSLALTRSKRQPVGLKVKDRILANAASKAGLRQYLPKRVDAGDVANSLEALVGHLFLEEQLTVDEMVEALRPREMDYDDDSKPFLRLALFAMERLDQIK